MAAWPLACVPSHDVPDPVDGRPTTLGQPGKEETDEPKGSGDIEASSFSASDFHGCCRISRSEKVERRDK